MRYLFGVVVLLGDAIAGVAVADAYKIQHGHLDQAQMGVVGAVAVISLLVIWYLVASERKKTRDAAAVRQAPRRPYSGIRQ